MRPNTRLRHPPTTRPRHAAATRLRYRAASCGVAILLAGVLPYGVPAQAPAGELRFAAFRVVRATPGEPSRPEIVLPAGYALVPGERYHVSSRAEHYAFIQGPPSKDGVVLSVRWPGESIEAVIGSNRRLALERHPGYPSTVTFRLPVGAASPDADQSTIQVWSHMETVPGIRWRIEHNDPDRAAGPWADVPWPDAEARAVIHYLVASEAILRDAGLAAAAAERGHFFALMGFETNNTLHPDNPPHWHLSYYAGNHYRAPAYLPHFWVDAEGRTFYNGMDVTGTGRLRLQAGDPGPMYDFAGNLILTTTIRGDGGLDLNLPGGPAYAIVPGPGGGFVEGLGLERDGLPWLRVRSENDVRAGRLVIEVTGEQDPNDSRTEVHTYDPLTGALTAAGHPNR